MTSVPISQNVPFHLTKIVARFVCGGYTWASYLDVILLYLGL